MRNIFTLLWKWLFPTNKSIILFICLIVSAILTSVFIIIIKTIDLDKINNFWYNVLDWGMYIVFTSGFFHFIKRGLREMYPSLFNSKIPPNIDSIDYENENM